MPSNPFLVNARMMNIRPGVFNGAGTASSPRFVGGIAFYGDEPSPPLLAHFLPLLQTTDLLERTFNIGSIDPIPSNRRHLAPGTGRSRSLLRATLAAFRYAVDDVQQWARRRRRDRLRGAFFGVRPSSVAGLADPTPLAGSLTAEGDRQSGAATALWLSANSLHRYQKRSRASLASGLQTADGSTAFVVYPAVSTVSASCALPEPGISSCRLVAAWLISKLKQRRINAGNDQ